MKLLFILAAALTLAGVAQAAPPHRAGIGNPKDCGDIHYATVAACGDTNAEYALVRYMSRVTSPGWDAQIRCQAFAGLMRYRCAWKDSYDKGSAWVLFGKPPAYKVAVKIISHTILKQG